MVGMAAREVDSMGPIFLGWLKVLEDLQKCMAVMCSRNYPKELGKAKLPWNKFNKRSKYFRRLRIHQFPLSNKKSKLTYPKIRWKMKMSRIALSNNK